MRKIVLFTILLSIVFYCDLFSQITGTIQAKGIVLNPISITATRDLDFGDNIIPGMLRTIDKTAASSGKFSLLGQPSKQINVSLTTPSTLINGVQTLPINFTSTDGGYKTTTGSMVAFDPASPTNAVLGTDGVLDVFLGGRVDPAHNQSPGFYTGTVNISLYYTGN